MVIKIGSPKYIVITGGVMSGLGKGLLAASLARLLESTGYNVIPIKFDGYLNMDAGTINPYKHGEVFVLDDGTETDMDLGEYERFLNKSLDSWSSLTGGRLFHNFIEILIGEFTIKSLYQGYTLFSG